MAFNIAELREEKGWTQERAATEVAAFLGRTWSKASFSAAERSVEGRRIRKFDADELAAFALAFDVGVWRLFAEPDHAVRGKPVAVTIGSTVMYPGELTIVAVRYDGLASGGPVTQQHGDRYWKKVAELHARYGTADASGMLRVSGVGPKQKFREHMEAWQQGTDLTPDTNAPKRVMKSIRRRLKAASTRKRRNRAESDATRRKSPHRGS